MRSDMRLCDSKPASERDVSPEDWIEIREARAASTHCVDCQGGVQPRDVQPEFYGLGRMFTPHLYVVPVLSRFNAFRNCSHCRWNTATVYEFAGGPAAYFALGAPDFAEAGDLKGYELAAANTR